MASGMLRRIGVTVVEVVALALLAPDDQSQ